MTFEDEKLQEAMQVLKDMEKRCAQDMGWMKTVKNKVFGAATAVRVNIFSAYLATLILTIIITAVCNN